MGRESFGGEGRGGRGVPLHAKCVLANVAGGRGGGRGGWVDVGGEGGEVQAAMVEGAA